ncbi:His-Xaa-Ser system radical SAM maturase HxsC [Rhizobium oryzicola]|uniref:His-Xaa-Ser system radical SAM maturase HxsC n=1 Tax=Rhizobium oryzicola TaxID=1232668 RepID=A0ABT8T023_9HYPH|nr:His-Xaa-Ser system radical SAM maturase HxsC [Rhizobium oryzicola]MDO1583608.1 His-Xaa-Ser system radical SAM maturase HxsC [Rhizobium oryzicola]
MIQLRLPVEPLPIVEPIIVRLRDNGSNAGPADAVLIDIQGSRREYDLDGFSLVLEAPAGTPLDQDVIMLVPGQASARRLIRGDSNHNTLLVTEQCDQLCIMCSQPPKKHHIDLFPQLHAAASLAPQGAYIGISGGEPLLHKRALFEMLLSLSRQRSDLKFHVLTNGQHFDTQDRALIEEIGVDRILWGIPLYAADGQLHDEIVNKEGAFDRLLKSFSVLFEAGASVELRTVVLEQNYQVLPELASFVGTTLPFVERWAIMQLESIGFGRKNWSSIFRDTSIDFSSIARCINIAVARDVPVQLYNFPLCSIPARYREYAPATISDWKNKFEAFCDDCSSRHRCGGFFAWYDHSHGFKELGPI